jgi:asparagine synthase (glutamine-hydrolysing)
MCGITGWICYDRDLRGELDVLAAMTATMACRGPDAAGTWTGQHALLGHRRLAVIDIEGGAQPMSVATPGGTLSLVFSGEIYNFVELRRELNALGETFRTASDTEVVLRGYLRWGDSVAERLNGMYAFAVWDARDQRLTLVRDRLGIKPLFLMTTPAGLLFGSEPKAILAHPGAPRVVDMDGVRELLAFVMTPRCAIWSGMRQVEPGTVITVSRSGLRERTYWRLAAREHADDAATTVTRVRTLLDDTVTRQLVADVPRCVLLSGGLDSGALTALAAAALRPGRVRTFAVDFVGRTESFVPDDLRATPDAPYVHAVAEHAGTEHTNLVLSSGGLADPAIRRAAVSARDLPVSFGDMDFSLYLLFRAIRERSTVALSGEVSDELFGGYRQYHDERIRRSPEFPWVAINAGPFDRDSTGIDPALLKALAVDEYRRDRYGEAVAEIERPPGENDDEYRTRVMTYLHLTRFARFLLERKDRLSMAVGLEVRVPYGDHRLIEYVYNAPWSVKVADGREKSLLRAAVRDALPPLVLARQKAAYPSTQDTGYVAELQRQAAAIRPGHDALALIDRDWLASAVRRDPGTLGKPDRLGLERALDVATWLDLYRPTLNVDAG